VPRHRRGVGQFFAGQPLREAEVQDLDLAVGRHHHVGALEIAMDHAAAVRVRQRVSHLLAVTQHLRHRQRAVGHAGAERLPLDQLHGDVGHRLR
jgi:hypothetical protein